jgi:hypothetical protein
MHQVLATPRGCAMAFMLAAVMAVMSPAAPLSASELPRVQAPFSADSTFAAGGMTIDGKIWQQDGKRRQEMSVQGQNQTMIMRPDLGVMYMIMPGTNMAMEMALSPEMAGADYEQILALSPQAVGEETVSGLPTTKYRIESDAGSVAGQMTGYSWITEDGIVVKMEAEVMVDGTLQNINFLLQNVQRGPQDPALFELPAGLQVMKMQ